MCCAVVHVEHVELFVVDVARYAGLLAGSEFVHVEAKFRVLALVARGDAQRADVRRAVVPLVKFVRIKEVVAHGWGLWYRVMKADIVDLVGEESGH
jgi:hypothetical protein